MRTLKRFSALLLAALTVLTGCHSERGSEDSALNTTAELTTASQTSTSAPDTTAPSQTTRSVSTAPTTGDDAMVPQLQLEPFQIPDSEGLRFVRDLGIGWNLGNTFDAHDAEDIEDEMDYESAWCGEVTTKETIAAVKEAGFQTVRIPVSWHNHVDANFQISQPWLQRVREVADWCLESGLYVIVNIHHDNAQEYYYPDNAHLEASKKYCAAIWRQVAEAFADCDDHLILESLNEPRLVGTSNEWWFDPNNAQCREALTCINTLNQLFVDTVRAAGGNNARRYLLCPAYCAAPDAALDGEFRLPNDPQNRVILSVHAYTPYDFALDMPGRSDFSCENDGDKRAVTDFMDKIYQKFVQNGTPVLISEFGARSKDNLEARVQFAAFYTAAARARGISCCWWDNNSFTDEEGENFGLLFRSASVFSFPEIVAALIKYGAV